MRTKIKNRRCDYIFLVLVASLVGCYRPENINPTLSVVEKSDTQSASLLLPNKPSSKVGFDFETGDINETINSDISFTMSETGFVVAKPENNSLGLYLTTLSTSSAEDYSKTSKECNLRKNDFLHGGKPITSKGDVFCWRTNEGRMVIFLIEKFDLERTNINIGIRYSIFDN